MDDLLYFRLMMLRRFTNNLAPQALPAERKVVSFFNGGLEDPKATIVAVDRRTNKLWIDYRYHNINNGEWNIGGTYYIRHDVVPKELMKYTQDGKLNNLTLEPRLYTYIIWRWFEGLP